MSILMCSYILGCISFLVMQIQAAVGMAKTPPVPIKSGLRDGICPQQFVYPADLKFFPDEDNSSILIVCLLSYPLLSGKLLVITSQMVSFWNSTGNKGAYPFYSNTSLTTLQVEPDQTQIVLFTSSMVILLSPERFINRPLLSNFYEIMIFSLLVTSSIRTITLKWYLYARDTMLDSSSVVLGQSVMQLTLSFNFSFTMMLAQKFYNFEFILLISTFFLYISQQMRKLPPRKIPQKTILLKSFSLYLSMILCLWTRRKFMKLILFSRVLVRYLAKYSLTLLQKKREVMGDKY